MYKFRFLQPGLGEIQIDDFKERFESDESYWSQEKYEAHWRAASERVAQGLDAYFITSTPDPKTANFIRGWACYPKEDELVFQEHLLFLDEFEKFDIEQPYKHMLAYESTSEDGEEISEWRTHA